MEKGFGLRKLFFELSWAKGQSSLYKGLDKIVKDLDAPPI